MKSVKEHLTDFHERSAQHHLGKAIACGVLAKCHGTLAKSADENDDGPAIECNSKMADQFQSMSDDHTAQAKWHTTCAKALAADSGKADKSVTSKADLGELAHFAELSGTGTDLDDGGDSSPVVKGFEQIYR